MIDGLTATWVSNTDTLKEIELRETVSQIQQDGLVLSVILVVGPPDPNALSYLVPRSVFERGLAVHVGALSTRGANTTPDVNELLDEILNILEVMNPHEIVVFICDTQDTLTAAVNLMGL
ncbi:hypothetical protein [Orrella daihaiensis]|uniref:Uncharacterized protein n=1 Tax=Orrella daihaiensis TaxID=2782176 RepID=A0ABY4AHI8_9BURK|nr:hypothetical protein [Orrella daihaiensis]UOD49757.1 hypothetical protein DHf2319_09865 [Orrella daihaiensis]